MIKFPIRYTRDLLPRAFESLLTLLFSTFLALTASKLLSLQSKGIIEINLFHGLLLIVILLGLLLWDITRQIRISSWERKQDDDLLEEVLKLPESQRVFSWFRIIPLLDSYRKMNLHEVVPTYWSLISTSFLAAIIIFKIEKYWAFLVFFYVLYLLSILNATLRHVKLREEIENEISAAHSQATLFHQRQIDWLAHGRISEYKNKLEQIFDQFWIIFQKTLKNGIGPTILIEMTWSIIFISSCLWCYFKGLDTKNLSSPFLSVVIFELLKSFSALNSNCFKIGESIQVKKYLNKIWDQNLVSPPEEKRTAFSSLKISNLNYFSKGLKKSLDKFSLELGPQSMLCLFALDKDKSDIFLSLLKNQIKSASDQIILTPPNSEIVILDWSNYGSYSSYLSAQNFVLNRMKERQGALFIIDSILDDHNDFGSSTLLPIIKTNQLGCILITQNKFFLKEFENFKILT
jgi:hypothetical protein